MRSKLIVAGAALLAGTALALAQGNMGKEHGKEGASPAPAAQQNAPAEKVAPGHSDMKGKAETGRAMEQKAQAPAPKGKAETTGQAPKETFDAQKPSSAQPSKPNTDIKANDTKSPAGQKTFNGQQSSQPAPTGQTTGQGAAGSRGAANLTSEQRTKITAAFKSHRAAPITNVNFSISVGAKVPRTVHFTPLPSEIIAIYPAWRGYDYIVVREEILIIDPHTGEIVAILEA